MHSKFYKLKIVHFFLWLYLLIPSLIEALEPHSPFVVFTPPKCGTHLIGKILGDLLEEVPAYYIGGFTSSEDAYQRAIQATQSGHFVVSHQFDDQVLKRLTEEGYIVILILRDPRDQLLSTLEWLHEGQWPWMPVAHISDRNEQLEELITGSRYGWRCYECCIEKRLFSLNFLDPKSYYITHFEDLVGEQGKGGREQQLQEMNHLAEVLGLVVSPEKIAAVAKKAFGGTATFRNGLIGRWQTDFLPYHKLLYKNLYGPTLIKLGYEKDLSW